MSMAHIVDLDNTLISWAMEKLGSDYTVEKIDASKVEVQQKAVFYQSSQEWWTSKTVHEEVFDNHESFPATWSYNENVQFDSSASWTIIKALKSNRVLPMSFDLDYPVSVDRQKSLSVNFDCTKLSDVNKTMESATTTEFTISEDITVEPYNSSKVSAQVRLCKLHDVMFTTDLLLWGTIKVQGHKKNKKWTKHELSASIVDALASSKALGFNVIENTSDMDAPARQIVFRIEGLCSGEVAVGTRVTEQDLVTSV